MSGKSPLTNSVVGGPSPQRRDALPQAGAVSPGTHVPLPLDQNGRVIRFFDVHAIGREIIIVI